MGNKIQEFTIFTKNWTNVTAAVAAEHSLADAAIEFVQLLRSKFDVIESYLYLNMHVVRCKAADINQIKNHEVFMDAFVMSPISNVANVMRGLNELQNQYLYQGLEWSIHASKGVTFPNERFEGGIFPADTYPASPNDNYRVSARRKFICPPAYMPVLNLSFGPKFAENTHVDHALQILSETRLITVSAGNDGSANGNTSSINRFIRNAEHPGILVVGAADDSGNLADYSSTGLKNERFRRPCVIAKAGKFSGTSYSAPKVANLACLCFDAIFQLACVECRQRSNDAAGVPLVGWGILDRLDGEISLPGRSEIPAMPFIGVLEKKAEEGFSILNQRGMTPIFSIHGPPVRKIIMESAKKLPGYQGHEVGRGIVSQELLLDYIADMSLGKILVNFCDNIRTSKIPADVWNLKLFDREELEELARIGNASRPIWLYDYSAQTFVVNRIRGGQLAPLPNSHGGKVASAGANIV